MFNSSIANYIINTNYLQGLRFLSLVQFIGSIFLRLTESISCFGWYYPPVKRVYITWKMENFDFHDV